MTQERNLNEELLAELKKELPTLEGFTYLSEDPLKNHIFVNDGLDGRTKGVEYKVVHNGNVDDVLTVPFQVGNPSNGVNGLTIEALIEICISRVQEQDNILPHWHNNFVIDGLTIAANAMHKRSVDREAAGILNTNKPFELKGESDMHPLIRRILTNLEMTTFAGLMFLGLSESYAQNYDVSAEKEYLELRNNSENELEAQAKIKITPKEDEALTVATSACLKTVSVIEQETLMRVWLGTLVHAKKLQASAATSETSTPKEQPSNTTT